jgi:serine/threonine protein kinase
MALTAGSRLGPYEILSLLGAGGMGEVYRALDPRLDREVAIKVLPPERMDEERRRRFVLEARAASALNHPNIVTIHEIESAEGRDFIVMEYVAGKSLDRLIPRQGMPLGEVLRIATPIADALARAHGRGIVHRDLKPANVVVGSEGTVKLLDFGSQSSWSGATASSRRPIRRDGCLHHERTGRASSSAPSPTCRRNRPRESPSTPAPTSSPSAPSSTRCSRVAARLRGIRTSRR